MLIWLAVTVVGAFLAFGFTYAMYIFVMAAKRKWKDLHIVAKILLAPWALLAFVGGDIFLVNMLIGTALFIQPPTQLTFTSRLGRNERRTGDGWITRYRRKVAHWICVELLEPFDPGHC